MSVLPQWQIHEDERGTVLRNASQRKRGREAERLQGSEKVAAVPGAEFDSQPWQPEAVSAIPTVKEIYLRCTLALRDR